MTLDTEPFLYEFTPGAIRFGRGCTAEMGSDFADRGYERALVVTGSNVGANEAVMDPIADGLGDRLVEVFDRTTPEKSMHTAYDAHEVVEENDIDVLVGVGAGSSLDIATMTSALYARYRPVSEIQAEVDRTGHVVVEEAKNEFLPLVFVPTTLTGADLSAGAGIKVPERPGERGVLNSALTLSAGYYDPDLFETTPEHILIGSAMNSFDKGIEALYSRHGEPITDGTAIRGLRYFRWSLPRLREADDPTVMERAVLGGILTQFGVTVPHATKLAVVHAMCHALRHQFGVQQGIAHALIVPHALRWVLDESTGDEAKLAEALDVAGADDTKKAIVEAVTAVRDGLQLPSRLRDIDGVARGKLREAAVLAHEDALMRNGPDDLEPTVDAIEAVFRAAW
ncbi:iron-containing alcohol dehydrogenase family protein [Halomarina halobia]|uniref:Iron-containing alcohol dehydrogenase family protein n=1 Tax=Halomarina halobia TaxID=3033386 RepID=A0ABD6AEP0_9EURY|nr:iron-containing alcohol dehydrogenase family protein [Halomarina sp. PSR21]